jgi:hypothetical protein
MPPEETSSRLATEAAVESAGFALGVDPSYCARDFTVLRRGDGESFV